MSTMNPKQSLSPFVALPSPFENSPFRLMHVLPGHTVDNCQVAVQEFGRSGGQWHSLAYSQKTNAAVQSEPQGDFELCCGLLIPLYAARATEEVFYGKQGVTLGTAQEVCICCCCCCCCCCETFRWQSCSHIHSMNGLIATRGIRLLLRLV